MELSEDLLAALFDTWPVARLSTISADGKPHAVPIVFCGHEGTVYSPVDGKRKRSVRLKRMVNVKSNPNATLLFDEYTSNWQNLWWIRIDAHADWYEPGTPASEQIAQRLKNKYPQYNEPSLMFDTTGYLRFRPTRVSAWAQTNTAEPIIEAIEGTHCTGLS